MDNTSERYRIFPRLSHLPAFSLESFPFTDEELNAAGLLGEGESLTHFARLPHTYHLPCRRLYHTDHLAFRSVPVHATVYQPLQQSQVPFLTRLANP